MCVVRVWGVCGVRGCSVVQPAPGHLTVTSTVILLNSEMPQLRHRVLCLWGSTVGSGGAGGRGAGPETGPRTCLLSNAASCGRRMQALHDEPKSGTVLSTAVPQTVRATHTEHLSARVCAVVRMSPCVCVCVPVSCRNRSVL